MKSIYEATVQIASKQMDRFISANPDLLALTVDGAKAVRAAVAAELLLHQEFEEEAGAIAKEADKAGVALNEGIANDLICYNIYKHINEAFLRLKARGAIQFVAALTPEAEAQLQEVEIAAGCHTRRPANDPIRVALTEAQFDERIVEDWKNLPTAEIAKKRKADSRYNTRLVEMLNSGALA